MTEIQNIDQQIKDVESKLKTCKEGEESGDWATIMDAEELRNSLDDLKIQRKKLSPGPTVQNMDISSSIDLNVQEKKVMELAKMLRLEESKLKEAQIRLQLQRIEEERKKLETDMESQNSVAKETMTASAETSRTASRAASPNRAKKPSVTKPIAKKAWAVPSIPVAPAVPVAKPIKSDLEKDGFQVVKAKGKQHNNSELKPFKNIATVHVDNKNGYVYMAELMANHGQTKILEDDVFNNRWAVWKNRYVNMTTEDPKSMTRPELAKANIKNAPKARLLKEQRYGELEGVRMFLESQSECPNDQIAFYKGQMVFVDRRTLNRPVYDEHGKYDHTNIIRRIRGVYMLVRDDSFSDEGITRFIMGDRIQTAYVDYWFDCPTYDGNFSEFEDKNFSYPFGVVRMSSTKDFNKKTGLAMFKEKTIYGIWSQFPILN